MPPCEIPEHTRPLGRWKHGAIPAIGLIGEIGSGKSKVAQLLAEHGAAVIDADAVGHALLRESRIRAQIVEQFGPAVVAGPDSSGAADSPPIDRRALGSIVFADPLARRTLEAIVHPAMRSRFLSDIRRAEASGTYRLVVLDAAILLEAGWDDLCDRIVFVDAPRIERSRRVVESRGWSESTLAARERAQWPHDQKRNYADWVIKNDGDLDLLREEIDRLLSLLQGSRSLMDASTPCRPESINPLSRPVSSPTR
jgi:dephospho-CoA kinase